MMHQQPNSSYHSRSFSFSGWDSKDYNSRSTSKYYYNYQNNNDTHERSYENHQPENSFGQNYQYKSGSAYKKYERVEYEKYKQTNQSQHWRENYTRPNYSLENNQKKASQPKHVSRTRENKYSIGSDVFQENAYSRPLKNNDVSRLDLQKATEQKLSNIDKINEKIKRILNTLNQQEKRLTQHHTKMSTKKVSSLYGQRIKTQGDITQDENQRGQNIYSKLTDIRQKIQNRYHYDVERQRTPLMQVNRNQQKSYEQQQHRKERIENIEQNRKFNNENLGFWNENKLYSNNYTCNEREKVRNIQKKQPYLLLKGTNVKSTDSLNLSMSLVRKDNQQVDADHRSSKHPYETLNTKQYTPYQQMQSPYETIQTSGHKYQSTDKNKRGGWQYRQYVDHAEQKKDRVQQNKQYVTRQIQQRVKADSSVKYKHTKSIQSEQQIKSFHATGGDKRRQLERTPKREFSKSRLEKSQKSCMLSNGKNLDAQIDRIQQKINSFQNIKKELNIQEDENTKKSRLSLNRSLSKYLQNNKLGNQSYSIQKKQQAHKTSFAQPITQFKTQKKQNQSFRELQKPVNTNNSVNITDADVGLPKPFKMGSRKNTRRNITGSEVRQTQSTIISEDKNESQPNSHIKILLQKLCAQIQFDTKFRNSKKWFHRKTNPKKWVQLAKELVNKNINTTDQQNRQIFMMTEEQDNPFHTDREDECSYVDLINNFLNSQKHWIQNLQHKFRQEQIVKNINEMDIGKKGEITIEDMVRYVNLESDKYYRNRDLSLIFRRLSGLKGEVTVNYIISQFCNV